MKIKWNGQELRKTTSNRENNKQKRHVVWIQEEKIEDWRNSTWNLPRKCWRRSSAAQKYKGTASLAPQRQPDKLQKLGFSGLARTRVDLIFTAAAKTINTQFCTKKKEENHQKTKNSKSLTLEKKIRGVQAIVASEFSLFSTFLHDFLYFLH